MNDNINNRIFLYVVLLVNGIFIFFIFQETAKYNNNISISNQIQTLEKDLMRIEENQNYKNLKVSKEKYDRFRTNFNSENRLQDFLAFLEKTTLENSITVEDIQFPVSNETESISKVELKGTIENYYNFIVDLENDKALKEIVNSSIEMEAGLPILFLEIRSYKF